MSNSIGNTLILDINRIKEILRGKSKGKKNLLKWSSGAKISIRLCQTSNDLELAYEVDGETKQYKIQIDTVPSNLGKGFRYYFICPESGKRCNKLYLGYGSKIFKHLEAYQERLYYPDQLKSRKDRLYKYHQMRRKIEDIKNKSFPEYDGVPTKNYQRADEWKRKADTLERKAWSETLAYINSMVRG